MRWAGVGRASAAGSLAPQPAVRCSAIMLAEGRLPTTLIGRFLGDPEATTTDFTPLLAVCRRRCRANQHIQCATPDEVPHPLPWMKNVSEAAASRLLRRVATSTQSVRGLKRIP